MQPRALDAEQHSSAGAPTTMFVEPRRGPYTTELGTLITCAIHHWSGPNVSLIEGAAPVCWETGHLLDEGEARRAAAR